MKHEKKKWIALCIALAVIAIAVVFAVFKNLTGVPYSEIVSYQQEHPNRLIYYSVTIDGGKRPMKISNYQKTVKLKACEQAESLAEQAEYLQHLTAVSFEEMTPTAYDVAVLRKAFPNTEIQFVQVEILGKTYSPDCTEIDLSHITSPDVEEAGYGINALPALEKVILSQNGTISPVSLADAAALQEANPELFIQYTTELFGQTVSTDLETLEYIQVPIGNEGLDAFRKMVSMMPNLTYLKLDTCEIDDEVMAAFREEYKDKCKVVWRVFFGQNNALTDTYKIWATWNVDTKEVEVLKYCNEVKYLDLGHNSFMNLDFLKTMPDLEMAILAIGNLQDISGIVGCTKLEFLEIFSNRSLTDEDMQHLSALTNMKYLNISNTILMRDLSFTDNMPKLRKLWCTISRVPWAERERVKALHPDCQFVFLADGDPTDYGWRYTRESGYTEMTPEYALVRARFGYSEWDFSRDEKGYLREEITYEDLGLTPS